MVLIRRSEDRDFEQMLAVISAAAEAYRGVIAEDCWHDPYMSTNELRSELRSGVSFFVAEQDGRIIGLMGMQRVANVELLRHAYVSPDAQGFGIGKRLVEHVIAQAELPLLVGTWAAATWAVRFYERNGFELVPEAQRAALLQTYWSISGRQIETSVVLARPALTNERALELMHLHRPAGTR